MKQKVPQVGGKNCERGLSVLAALSALRAREWGDAATSESNSQHRCQRLKGLLRLALFR